MLDRKQKLEDLIESAHAMRKGMFFRDANAKQRISPAQWLAMRIIGHHPDCTIKLIAEKMQMTSSAATQVVEKLVQNGYVTRKVSKDDRRAVTLSLAEKTAAEVGELKKQALQRMLKVFDVLNDKELEQYVALNKKIANAMEERAKKYHG